MRVAVTGSVATDHLMTFPGKFTDQLIADKLDKISLSFLVEGLEVRRGGVAANVAFGMSCLGLRPLLVAAVGADFGDYRAWLERHGVDTSEVLESARFHTARFVCTTDAEGNQLASFYPGAMSEARTISIGEVARRAGGLSLVLIGADDPEAMFRHTAECIAAGIPFAADPSQQLARMDGEQTRALTDGAAYLFSNEYEAALIERKTGWAGDEVLSHVGVQVTTLGAAGARVRGAGQPQISVAGVPVAHVADPTGAGDAFRAGFLTAVEWGLSLERAAQLGNILAAYSLETVGTQEYELKPGPLTERFAAAYGQAAAEEIANALQMPAGEQPGPLEPA
ncbi:MAG TPA: carbohydrate kinase family protein [Streptosporangiaceae bacterium]|nr:carbohydrate kinase family protein [Streptosporangiaceae bacterium]